MLLKKETYQIQQQFAEYCRNNTNASISGADQVRIQKYRDLVFTIVEDALQSAYPITHFVLQEEKWLQFVCDFFSLHPSAEPMLWKMPKQLYLFAVKNNYGDKINCPFLSDLLLFEWKEIEIEWMEDEEILFSEFSFLKNNLETIPVWNPDYEIIQLSYPVHLNQFENIENKKGNYFILIFRNRETNKSHFLELSPLLAYIIQTTHEESISITKALNTAIKQHNIDANLASNLKNGLDEFCKKMIQEKFLLGFN
ncbi:MAG: DNA-binding domain-containing protein [Bacteroidota bacterium]